MLTPTTEQAIRTLEMTKEVEIAAPMEIVMKPPRLLEICGPMFMSFPAISHLQYRLTAEGDVTRLRRTHGAMGQIPPDWLDGPTKGWSRGATPS